MKTSSQFSKFYSLSSENEILIMTLSCRRMESHIISEI